MNEETELLYEEAERCAREALGLLYRALHLSHKCLLGKTGEIPPNENLFLEAMRDARKAVEATKELRRSIDRAVRFFENEKEE